MFHTGFIFLLLAFSQYFNNSSCYHYSSPSCLPCLTSSALPATPALSWDLPIATVGTNSSLWHSKAEIKGIDWTGCLHPEWLHYNYISLNRSNNLGSYWIKLPIFTQAPGTSDALQDRPCTLCFFLWTESAIVKLFLYKRGEIKPKKKKKKGKVEREQGSKVQSTLRFM